MKKETFSKRKIGKQLVSVAMLGLLLAPIALSSASAVSAEEKSAQSTSNVDSELKTAIDKAKQLGVKIEVEGKKTFQSTAELNAFNQEQLNKVNQAIAKAEAAKANSDKDKAVYESLKKKYDEDKKKYDAEKAKYDAEIAKMEADKGKDGHLSQAAAQSLIYKSEPTAKATVSNATNALPISADGIKRAFEAIQLKPYYFDALVSNSRSYKIAIDSTVSTQENLSVDGKSGLGNGKGTVAAYRLERNASVTIDYTDLKNSSYNGEPLSKVSMTLSVDPSSENISEYGVLGFSNDPISGFNIEFRRDSYASGNYALKFNVTMRFYDSKGNLINLTDENNALLGMSSFNSTDKPTGTVEGFVPGQGISVIDITGSSIRNQNGKYYSTKPENTNNQFGQGNIDHRDNPYFWYLGSVLKMTGTSPTFQVFASSPSYVGRPETKATYIPGLWMNASSDLATTVAIKPAPPTPPTRKSVDDTQRPSESVKISEASLVITKHIDITTGKELTKEEEGTKPKRQFDGYEFVETKTVDGNTIHFYKPIDKVPIKPKNDKAITKHFDITTGKEIAPKEDGNQPKKDIPNYEFVETKTKTGETDHYYKPVKKVITKYINKSTGKELAPQEDGKQNKREFDGYKFVETKDEEGNTIHYYEPIAKVITKHIDIDTKEEIAPQEDGKQPKKDISGYEFVETKDDNGNTLHYYRKVKKQSAINGKTPKDFAKTGESASWILTSLGLAFAAVLGFLGFKKYRSSKESTK